MQPGRRRQRQRPRLRRQRQTAQSTLFAATKHTHARTHSLSLPIGFVQLSAASVARGRTNERMRQKLKQNCVVFA